jgi:hypothetical protein
MLKLKDIKLLSSIYFTIQINKHIVKFINKSLA